MVNSLANSFIMAHREVGASGDCAGLPTARSFMVHSAQGLGSWMKASSTTFPFSPSSQPVSPSVTHTGMLATLWQYSLRAHNICPAVGGVGPSARGCQG